MKQVLESLPVKSMKVSFLLYSARKVAQDVGKRATLRKCRSQAKEKGKKLLLRKAQQKAFLVSVMGVFLDDEEDEGWTQC